MFMLLMFSSYLANMFISKKYNPTSSRFRQLLTNGLAKNDFKIWKNENKKLKFIFWFFGPLIVPLVTVREID